jgi:hypothetical protein
MQSWKYLSSHRLAPALQMPIEEQLCSYPLAAPLSRVRLLHVQSQRPTPFQLLALCQGSIEDSSQSKLITHCLAFVQQTVHHDVTQMKWPHI